jgi:hypothetical protein
VASEARDRKVDSRLRNDVDKARKGMSDHCLRQAAVKQMARVWRQ